MARDRPLSPEHERRLLEAVRQGDRGALGELLAAYQHRVYHVCLRMVSHADDAAELTQDVLVRAIEHVDEFRGGSRFGTWLMRIAMNRSISHLRRRRVRRAVSLETAAGADTEDETRASPLRAMLVAEGEPSAEQSVETEEQIEHLTRALEALDPALRSVILLRDLDAMDYRAISETLSTPVGTVKSRLFRARLALRRAMDHAFEPHREQR